MDRITAIGLQDFEKIISRNCFYVDKTSFIKEWWENGDDITLLTRPRRFGKTLMLSVLEYYFSIRHAGKAGLFAHLAIWKEEEYRKLQGTYPVISLSFANIKEHCFENTIALASISSFDSGIKLSEDTQPERFYHGFVLGLIVQLDDRYVITSNRESGLGRCDVLLKPRSGKEDGIVLEFKVCSGRSENTLQDTAKNALVQIVERKYTALLEAEGILKERIRIYGFAFQGKEVWIDGGPIQNYL